MTPNARKVLRVVYRHGMVRGDIIPIQIDLTKDAVLIALRRLVRDGFIIRSDRYGVGLDDIFAPSPNMRSIAEYEMRQEDDPS